MVGALVAGSDGASPAVVHPGKVSAAADVAASDRNVRRECRVSRILLFNGSLAWVTSARRGRIVLNGDSTPARADAGGEVGCPSGEVDLLWRGNEQTDRRRSEGVHRGHRRSSSHVAYGRVERLRRGMAMVAASRGDLASLEVGGVRRAIDRDCSIEAGFLRIHLRS